MKASLPKNAIESYGPGPKEEFLAMVQAIVGANWGDEGKGKITDLLAGEADVLREAHGKSVDALFREVFACSRN